MDNSTMNNNEMKTENRLQREMLDMNKQTIQHMERDINHWFKSWWMLSIVYPLVVTVGGAVLVTVIQKHRATPERKAPVTRDTNTTVRRPIRDIIRDRLN